MRIDRLCLRAAILLLVGLAIAGISLFKTSAQNATLIVSVDQHLGRISPYVYGANQGPWALVPPDMWPTAKDSGITYLRFPAGDWGDLNDLTPFHIDMFITFARLIHAEPSISARLKGGTPEAAAELVRYVNVEKKYGVRYWSVGNEPNLYKDYSIEQYVSDWRKFALAMLAVDPNIVLVGPDTSQYPPPEVNDPGSVKARDWLRAFLTANGDLIKIVAVHRYPLPKGMNADPTTIDELRQTAPEWDVIIPQIRKVIQETTGHGLPLGITEVNSHWTDEIGGQATPDSFYHAIWWADVLGRMIRQRVEIVAYFTLYTASSPAGFGLISRYDARPTYYVYKLYQKFGTQLVASESSGTDVSITAALREDGALTLMIVNLGPSDQTETLSLSGFTPKDDAEVWRFDQDHRAESVGPLKIGKDQAITLPKHTITLLIFSAK